MPSKTYINDNGTWRAVRAIYINDGTAWRTVKSQFVNDNGTWRLVHRGVFVFTETISINTSDYNLRTKLTNAGWDGEQDVEATITINPGVNVYGTPISLAAFLINPGLPTNSTVSLTNRGSIIGRGGAGGVGGGVSWPGNYTTGPNGKGGTTSIPDPITAVEGAQGQSGGTAVRVSSPITINNLGSIIGGGGGGGGGSYAGSVSNQSGPPAITIADAAVTLGAVAGGTGGSGGGGSSLSPSSGGTGGLFTPLYSPGVNLRRDGANGNSGTDDGGAAVPGLGISGYVGFTVSATGGYGGTGGARGNGGGFGGKGSATFYSGGPNPGNPVILIGANGAGGSAGFATSGYSKITFTNLGTIVGSHTG